MLLLLQCCCNAAFQIQEIRLLEKMIKIRQEESGIVGVLEQRYPIQKPGSALAPQVASTGSEPEHFRMAEPVVTAC